MEVVLALFSTVALAVAVYYNFIYQESRMFTEYLQAKIRRTGFKVIKEEVPETFTRGPFKEDEFSLGKEYFDSDLMSKYKRVHYRKIVVKRKQEHKIWARIVTGRFSDYKIKFRPTIKELMERERQAEQKSTSS